MESKIRDIAYRLWEEAGRPESDGVEFWLLAEKICAIPIADSEIDVGYYFPQDNPKTINILKKFGRKE